MSQSCAMLRLWGSYNAPAQLMFSSKLFYESHFSIYRWDLRYGLAIKNLYFSSPRNPDVLITQFWRDLECGVASLGNLCSILCCSSTWRLINLYQHPARRAVRGTSPLPLTSGGGSCLHLFPRNSARSTMLSQCPSGKMTKCRWDHIQLYFLASFVVPCHE